MCGSIIHIVHHTCLGIVFLFQRVENAMIFNAASCKVSNGNSVKKLITLQPKRELCLLNKLLSFSASNDAFLQLLVNA